MTAALLLWTHALAALLFALLALSQRRRPGGALPRTAFIVALAMTALWALAVAGIDARDVSARIAESARNIAWLAFMFALVRRDRGGGLALGAVYAVVMLVAASCALIAAIASIVTEPEAARALTATRLLLRMMTAVSALVLVHQLNHAAAGPARGGIRLIALALAAMWGTDLLVFTAAYLRGWPPTLIVIRGMVMIGVGLVVGGAAHRSDDWTLSLSRKATMRSLGAVGIALYAGIVALLTGAAETLGGDHARLAQTAIVMGAATAFLTFASTPWLRAWTKVKIAKHLFSHRYDYREEWQRFTETLGQPGEGAAPLGQRVVKAIADLTDSPAGLLLVPHGQTLGVGAAWEWTSAETLEGEALGRHLAATGRIIELDVVRGGGHPQDAAAVPPTLLDRDDAWAIVPLSHLGDFVGAIVLARPPVDRALDWEDFDLLRVAGRQAASYLAEERAHGALADAERFDEFNRRFAFILHDLKNLVSQHMLIARNAERHADNPDFRADMVATLKDSADRMNALLARLSQHHGGRSEATQPVDVAALAERVARSRRAQHPVLVDAPAAALALAQPARLEQVLGHLVQNAIEASAPGVAIRLVLTAGAGRMAMDVVDAGHGMSPAFVRDQLFRPFVSTKAAGFGIGAFEARQLVEAMGGAVEVTSREGEGTCFRVLLPLAPAMEAAA